MGSSCEANGNSIDSSVGGLVWVRRRNGSWWPGRILGPDELPESCLVSPRSGTPVKLLGREDASVDWYNLEKSKRVKAFRCGEYDECIKKAQATAASAISSKKAVKYARREDAILHALEIENSRIIPKNSPEKSDPKCEETENTSDKLSGLEYTSNSPPELDPKMESESESESDNPRNDSEEDGIEGSKKRMRGLEDIGISGTKRRRLQVARVHELLKKKNRRRQLTKVLESTVMVTVPVMCEELTGAGLLLPENKASGSFSVVINNGSDSTGDVSNNDGSNCKQKENEISSGEGLIENDSSGRLFDVPFIREEKDTQGFSPRMVTEKPQSGQSSLVDTISAGPTELQESNSINSSASKWQHKGKRNSRHKSKSIQKFLDPNLPDEPKPEQITESPPHRSLPYRQSRFTLNPKYESSSDFSYTKHDNASLYDVNIEVKVGHHVQHVPYISLMSKLTGQPITGHPLLVEVLDDDESDLELNSSECYSSSCELDSVNDLVNGDDRKVLEAGGKCTRKLKRNGILSNKKIRKLSSLTGLKRPCESGKFKKLGEACIPLNVVFGRINEALGRYVQL